MLTARKLVIPWPDTVPASRLRGLVLARISVQAEPLRWAVTAVEQSVDGSGRQLVVEAVFTA